jgi:hypothetical protein
LLKQYLIDTCRPTAYIVYAQCFINSVPYS